MDAHETEQTPMEPASPTPARPLHGRRHTLIGGIAVASLVALTLGVSVAVASPAPTLAPVAAAAVAAAEVPPLSAVAGATISNLGTGAPADVEKLNAAFTAYTACMRQHGIDMPDPVMVTAIAPDSVNGSGTIISGAGEAGTAISGTVLGNASEDGLSPADASGVSPADASGMVTGATPAQAPAFDPTSPAFKAADAACSPILEAAGINQAIASGDAAGSVVSSGSATVVAGGTVVSGGPVTAFTNSDPAAMNVAFTKYTACMRDHGIDMPEPPAIAAVPVPADGVPVRGVTALAVPAQGPATDLTSPAFVAADAECFPILQAAGAVRVTVGGPIPAQPAQDAVPAESQSSADPAGR